MQEKETWFPKFKPYQGNIDTTPVQTDEYLPAGKSIILCNYVVDDFRQFGIHAVLPTPSQFSVTDLGLI